MTLTLNRLAHEDNYVGFEIVEGDRSTVTVSGIRVKARVFLEGALE